ncbi:hypothetical protein Bpfe_011259, partial [Biomphalaria pfeifferi]
LTGFMEGLYQVYLVVPKSACWHLGGLLCDLMDEKFYWNNLILAVDSERSTRRVCVFLMGMSLGGGSDVHGFTSV